MRVNTDEGRPTAAAEKPFTVMVMLSSELPPTFHHRLLKRCQMSADALDVVWTDTSRQKLRGVSFTTFPVDPHVIFLHTRYKTKVSFGRTDPEVLLDPLTHTAMDLLLCESKATCTAAFHAQVVMSDIHGAKEGVSSLALMEVGQANGFPLLNPPQLPGE